MSRHFISLIPLMLLPSLLWAAELLPLVHHDLSVKILPSEHYIQVDDQIELPQPVKSFTFALHAELTARLATSGGTLTEMGQASTSVPSKIYQLSFAQPSRTVKLSYAGEINHPVVTDRPDLIGSRPSGTPGLISEEGVFLSASALWYPVIEHHMLSFTLRVSLPDGWLAVSQGTRLAETGWQEHAPQDDIYLIAGNFTVYRDSTAPIEAQVYLRAADAKLAQRYLQSTSYYIDLYQKLIGPYPYQKFAMVENFWESGYGMPSFTLLGPRVLRFPFILHSSYPHEILHNWWGNGVYVNYQKGNWSEGLTSYLADHLIKEQQGEGANYRRDTLQKYADFVHDGDDFPLTAFRGRHGDVSQAVGYGKTLMLFHMLRLKLGDLAFIDGLRTFYRDNLHHSASFDELRAAFEAASNQQLGAFFAQWTHSTGAPDLQISEVELQRDAENYRVSFVLQQRQPGQLFDIEVPVAIQTAAEEASIFRLSLKERSQRFELTLQSTPLRLVVDPDFDMFRQLASGETPSALSQLFGAEKITLILPSAASRPMQKALREVAASWKGYWEKADMVWDDELETLPEKGAILLFGTMNRFAAGFLQQLSEQAVSLTEQQLNIGNDSFTTENLSFVLTAPHTTDVDNAMGLLAIGPVDAASGLARKLPHYGKYSFAIFKGDEPNNILKGQWQPSHSALSIVLDTHRPMPTLRTPSRTPLMVTDGS